MPELRRDPLLGRWVIVATERARRPGTIVERRPSLWERAEKDLSTVRCEVGPSGTSESLGAGAEARLPVRVLPCGTPLLKPLETLHRRGHGLYDICEGYGRHEIVIDSPDPVGNMADLSVGQIAKVISVYEERIKALEKTPEIEYAIIYKNYIPFPKDELRHSYSQVLAMPVIPLHILQKLSGARRYYEFHERCVYSDIVRQEKADGRRLVAENEHFLAHVPFASRLLFEVWVLPKTVHCDFHEGVQGKEEALAAILKEVLLRMKVGLDDPSYTLVINSSPFRRKAGGANQRWKTIEQDYCWHIEVTPHLTRVAGFEKGTGFYICPVPPEDTAEFLRTVDLPEAALAGTSPAEGC